MHKKTILWDAARTLKKLEELVEPGVIGFYRSVEITEILGVRGNELMNILTLAVAEPIEAPTEIDWKSILLNGTVRHRLPGTEWDIGIAQYRLPLRTFLEKVAEFGGTSQWKPTPFAIHTGKLAAVAPQFVPADGTEPHPWNGLLKNNFFEGSHVLELFDTDKLHVWPLLNESCRLTNLAKIVGEYLPIKLDGMSDRLGNVIIQLPVTVISTQVRGSTEGDHVVAVTWHPEVPPRNVRVAAEIWQDSTLTSFDSAVTGAGEVKLRLNAPGGGARTNIWDDEKRILLSATSPLHFITSISLTVMPVDLVSDRISRKFFIKDPSGKLVENSVSLTEPTERGQLIGSSPEVPREPWVSQRVFRESVASLKERKEFVQYGVDETKRQTTSGHLTAIKDDINDETSKDESSSVESISRKYERRMTALEDLRWLMKVHGKEGVWLWDPFLSADDVLHTLFYCPHKAVPLRALTAGKHVPNCAAKQKSEDGLTERERQRMAKERAEQHKKEQADQLESSKGNCHGLHLEFRIREGSAGWGFHDRFIIFPRAIGSALAWSLGTSINSFGDEHHILQKVSHGEPIAQAFLDLWTQLEGERYQIWKTPAQGSQEQ